MSSIINSYNRPNFPYKCGRAALWGKPCALGPNANGSCGGATACAPRRSGDRFLCNRRPEHGGTCEGGPLPDGSCCLTQAACHPRRTLRAIRFRLSLVALVLVIALIGAFGSGGKLILDGATPMINPGPISNAHASVIGENSCVSCHDVHNEDVFGVLKAAFTPSGPTSTGVQNKCMNCHLLPTINVSVHNSQNCSSCHTEHKGGMKPPSKIQDTQCHSCHKEKFTTFSASHPNFGDGYPYKRRTAINFDHNAHLGTHFKDARYSEFSPEGKCIGCHMVDAASNAVPIRSFEEVCASCHEGELKNNALVLFQMPEFENDPKLAESVTEYCAIDADSSSEEFESVSVEELNPIMSALLEVDGGDVSSYEEKVGLLLNEVLEGGIEALIPSFEELDGNPKVLLAGLSPVVIKNAFCSWSANQEFETVEQNFGGWSADELSIKYNATKHRDQVLQEWLNFAAVNDEDILSETLLNKDGAGGCVKCHSVSETDEVRVEWKAASGSENSSHHKYSHAPHLNVLGPGSQCETCHSLDPSAEYSKAYTQRDPSVFESSFNPIKKETCVSCHAAGKVTQSCQTCHEYHDDIGFRANIHATNSANMQSTLASNVGK